MKLTSVERIGRSQLISSVGPTFASANEAGPVNTIWFDQTLRDQWPTPVADQWSRQYPRLFDADDLRITREQPDKHFYEWLTAICLFHTLGVLSLGEKYTFGKAHPRKHEVVKRLLQPDQVEFLLGLPNQPPDLLVYTPRFDRYWFVEVKGPTDRVRPIQRHTNQAIMQRLGVPVETISVRRATSGPTRS